MNRLAGALLVFALAAPAAAQEADSRDATFEWKAHPTFHLGDLRLEPVAKLREIAQSSDAPLDLEKNDASTLDMEQERVGVKGTIAKQVDFQVERELGASGGWKDVYVDYRGNASVQVQGGNFKLPFSLDENTGSTNLDFIYRSRIATQLAPGRDLGVMAHGRVARKVLLYEVGVFSHDGDNAQNSSGTKVQGGRTFAARIEAEPMRHSKSIFKDVLFGAAFTTSEVPDGFPGLRGRTPLDDSFFSSKYYVNGRRLREGVEARWRPGPWTLQSEFIRATDERRGDSTSDTDLAPFLADGWYVSGSVRMTGDVKYLSQHPLFPGIPGKFGAVDLAARSEQLSFGSVGGEGLPSTSPRTDLIDGNSDHVTTFGVSWYVNRWIKVQGNVIRDDIADPSRGPLPERNSYWSRVAMIQFVL